MNKVSNFPNVAWRKLCIFNDTSVSIMDSDIIYKRMHKKYSVATESDATDKLHLAGILISSFLLCAGKQI